MVIWLPIVLVNFLDARNLGIWEAAPPLGGREAARGMPEFRDSKKTSTTGNVIYHKSTVSCIHYNNNVVCEGLWPDAE